MACAVWLASSAVAQPSTLPVYSVGDWTDTEQLYLELINRARQDPTAEGVRLAATTDVHALQAIRIYAVDLTLMQAEFSVLAPAPPLAPNANLLTMARGHTADMVANQFQGHVGSDGSSIDVRAGRASYQYQRIGENVYAYAHSALHGHTAFEIDWGNDSTATGGMQAGRGHRANIHSASYREVGVGVTDGVTTTVGPQVVTQDFGTRTSASPLATGVVYIDLDGDGLYSAGEGVPGVEVTAAGGSFRALTNAAGGWALPLSGDGTYAVAFRDRAGSGDTAPAGTQSVAAVTISAGRNAKVDVRVPYAPTSPSGTSASVSFGSFWGASGYTAIVWRRSATRTFNAEGTGAADGLTFTTTTGYTPLQTGVVLEGLQSYRLVQPKNERQELLLDGEWLGGAASTLVFTSRLGFATTTQTARAQISIENGLWQDLYKLSGAGGVTESLPSSKRVALAGVDGKRFRLRFALENSGTSYYPPESNPSGSKLSGWFLDAIGFEGVESLTLDGRRDIGATTTFTPHASVAAECLVAIEPYSTGRVWPAGNAIRLSLVPAPPPLVIPGETELGDDWRTSSWLGTYYARHAPWIYHQKHGWLYTYTRSADAGHYFHDGTLGWLWTTQDAYPWLYSYREARWLYYYEGGPGQRTFWDATSQSWRRGL